MNAETNNRKTEVERAVLNAQRGRFLTHHPVSH